VTPAGRGCGLTGLTAAAFSSTGLPLLAGGCSRTGTAGIFADSAAGWRAVGPTLHGAPAREDVDVLRLAETGTGLVALLEAGAGPEATLVAAFSPAGSLGQWTLSAPLRIGTSQLLSTTMGPGWTVGLTLNGNRGLTLAGPGAPWHALPALPRWTTTLALGPSGLADAIAVHLSTFWDYRLQPGSGWSLSQKVQVNIPYGSSS
jgi:hypothetical protein